MDIITSPQNSRIREARKLANRKHRQATGLCLVEGIQPVLRALDNGVPIEHLIVAPDLLTSDVARERIETAVRSGTAVLRVSPEVYAGLSERDNPVGLAAVARQVWQDADRLSCEADSLFVVLHDIGSPGNLGTILRTADAFAVSAIILTGSTTDPYDTACIKASMGTVFGLNIASLRDYSDVLQWCRQKGLTLVTTSSRASQDTRQAKWRFPAAVAFGSEAQGLPPELLAAGDLQVRIPMRGQASSLNLSVAAGIVLYAMRGEDSPCV